MICDHCGESSYTVKTRIKPTAGAASFLNNIEAICGSCANADPRRAYIARADEPDWRMMAFAPLVRGAGRPARGVARRLRDWRGASGFRGLIS